MSKNRGASVIAWMLLAIFIAIGHYLIRTSLEKEKTILKLKLELASKNKQKTVRWTQLKNLIQKQTPPPPQKVLKTKSTKQKYQVITNLQELEKALKNARKLKLY